MVVRTPTCKEVATVIRDHLRAVSPSGSSVGDVEAASATALLQTAKLMAPPQECRLPGRGWRQRPGRRRTQHGDGRETSSLEAAEDLARRTDS